MVAALMPLPVPVKRRQLTLPGMPDPLPQLAVVEHAPSVCTGHVEMAQYTNHALPGMAHMVANQHHGRKYLLPDDVTLEWTHDAVRLFRMIKRDLIPSYSLVDGLWRLEMWQPETVLRVKKKMPDGEAIYQDIFPRPYYRLLCGTDIVGVQHIHKRQHEQIRRTLAMYLLAIGMSPDRVEMEWCEFDDDEEVPHAHRQPRLFKVKDA